MSEPLPLRDELERARIHDLIARLNLAKPWQVTVEPEKKRRTKSQNALYWMWLGDAVKQVASSTGNDADDVHEFFKRQFLTPRVTTIAGEDVQRWTTTKLTTQEMSEFIERVYNWITAELGILLPLPEELGRTRTTTSRSVDRAATDRAPG